MKVQVQAEAKVKHEIRNGLGLTLTLTLILTSALSLLSACGRPEEPTASNAATPPPSNVPVEIQSRIETAVVAYSPGKPLLTLAGKVAYGEDRYSRISSPLQGRVVEVRAHLGDRVKQGSVLLVIDSPDISSAYSEFVKEASELEYAQRAYELYQQRGAEVGAELSDWLRAEVEVRELLPRPQELT